MTSLDHHIKRFPRRVPILVMLATLFGFLVVAAPSHAQFSDTWEFFNALEDRDYNEMRSRLFKGANINAKHRDGRTAVIMAADDQDIELLDFLLENGANIDSRDDERSESALMRRAAVGDAIFVEILLERGADVDAVDRGGKTALLRAAASRSHRAVKALIDAGANIDHLDYTGRSALDYAREVRARRAERILIEAGAR